MHLKIMYEKVKKGELKKMLAGEKDFLLFDVRNYAAYLEKHIKGAKNLPTDVIDKEAPGLDKSKLVVVYCGGIACPLSGYAAEKLSRMGFKVKAYEGGIADWDGAVESG